MMRDYVQIFRDIDLNNSGFVNGNPFVLYKNLVFLLYLFLYFNISKVEDAEKVFVSAGVSGEILAKIWSLADRNKDNQLDIFEFVTAMYLLRCKNKGIAIPEKVPEQLLISIEKQAHKLGATNTRPLEELFQTIPKPRQRVIVSRVNSHLEGLYSL
jgi:hypothetical protein